MIISIHAKDKQMKNNEILRYFLFRLCINTMAQIRVCLGFARCADSTLGCFWAFRGDGGEQEGDKSNEMYFIGEGQLGVWMLSEESNNERGKGPKRSQQLMMMGAAAVREVLGAAEPHIPSENLKRSGRLRDASVDDPVYLKIGELEVGWGLEQCVCTKQSHTILTSVIRYIPYYLYYW
jgi:hypothetical protein